VNTYHNYLIALGSNLGNLEQNLNTAINKIEHSIGAILANATPYSNPPMGAASQWFLNSAIIVATKLDPELMLTNLLQIERSMGREREVRWGNRIIDLDIILWRDCNAKSCLYQSESLTIPHPACLEREFVLKPTFEIAKDWEHPVLNRTISEIYSQMLQKTKIP